MLARLPFIHTFTCLSFFVYFGHVWLLLQHPMLAVSIIGIFIAYGVVRFWVMWVAAFHGLFLMHNSDKRDPAYFRNLPRPGSNMDFDSVWHAVMVPAYKEPLTKLRQTLDTIADQSIAKRIVVCMAMEERDPKGAEVAEQLQREYGPRLGGFCYAIHPVKEGEVPGKSSNENWAARCIKKKLVDDMRINPDCIVITTCDADTFFHNNYFAAVSHNFCENNEKRHHRFYLPVTNFMPNVYAVPGVCDTRYTVLSVGRMSEMSNPLVTPFPLAIYSLPMRLAAKAEYWDPYVIPEDWHMYFRCMFADEGKVEPCRIMLMVGTEAVEGKDYFDTIKETYDQSVRWQWGAIDMGYLLMQVSTQWRTPAWKRAKLLAQAYDHHLFAVTMGMCLMTAPFLYGKIPVEFTTDMWFGTEMFVPLKAMMIWVWGVHIFLHWVFLCYADSALRRTVLRDRMHFYMEEGGEGANSGPYRWASLALFPIADIFLFLIPTIHAHARMFWSHRFNYVPSAKMGGRPLPGQQQRDGPVEGEPGHVAV